MATLVDTPSFTANEVYEIQATDTVEGAASGASFNGIGLSNQPHQQLANRTSFLFGRQNTNIANIATLLGFMGQFAGSLQANGYLTIPINDINRGSVVAYVQWGKLAPGGGLVADQDWSVTWPIAFPNSCLWAAASLSNAADSSSAGVVVMETVSVTVSSGIFKSDYNGVASGATGPGAARFNDGFFWLAIGF